MVVTADAMAGVVMVSEVHGLVVFEVDAATVSDVVIMEEFVANDG